MKLLPITALKNLLSVKQKAVKENAQKIDVYIFQKMGKIQKSNNDRQKQLEKLIQHKI